MTKNQDVSYVTLEGSSQSNMVELSTQNLLKITSEIEQNNPNLTQAITTHFQI